MMAPTCDDIRAGYRRRHVERHTVYFTIAPYGVAIVRVLHQRMDAARHLQRGARALGIDRALDIEDLPGMCAVVLALTPADFYKSMTTQTDHRIWQDDPKPYQWRAEPADILAKLERARELESSRC